SCWASAQVRSVEPFSTTTISNGVPSARRPSATAATDSARSCSSLWAGITTEISGSSVTVPRSVPGVGSAQPGIRQRRAVGDGAAGHELAAPHEHDLGGGRDPEPALEVDLDGLAAGQDLEALGAGGRVGL